MNDTQKWAYGKSKTLYASHNRSSHAIFPPKILDETLMAIIFWCQPYIESANALSGFSIDMKSDMSSLANKDDDERIIIFLNNEHWAGVMSGHVHES